MRIAKIMTATTALALCATAARADLAISNELTQNVSCSAGVCTATAQNAVLNAADLAGMLASGDVTVKTAAGAKDVEVQAPLSWASASRLTLDAQRSVIVKRGVSATGTGALTITTNDGHSMNGEFVIVPQRGSVQFWDLNSSVIVNGQSYTLVGDIKTLATDIAADPSGFYALAKPYDASVDGTYSGPVVTETLEGIVEGLGNAVSNLSMTYSRQDQKFGFFEHVGQQGTVRNLGLNDSALTSGAALFSGALAAVNDGLVEACWATGVLSQGTSAAALGGLVATNDGTIFGSYANVKVYSGLNTPVGGLVGYNAGLVSQSYSNGLVSGGTGEEGNSTVGGGLVGLNEAGIGRISDSFSLTVVKGGKHNCCYFGGLVGQNRSGATITSSYAAGEISQSKSSQSLLGGLIGDDLAAAGSLMNTYWDLDKGVSDPAGGAGNIRNDPGITGLTTQQLQSSLPTGFDPAIWGEQDNANGGFPYLKALAPK